MVSVYVEFADGDYMQKFLNLFLNIVMAFCEKNFRGKADYLGKKLLKKI